MTVLWLWLLVACVHVPAWQRSELMARCMSDPADEAASAFDGHVYATREGVITAGSGGAAACGCD